MANVFCKFKIKYCVIYVLSVVIIIAGLLWKSNEVYAKGFEFPADTDGELVIVIDPGHGGENLGAEYAGLTEKEINLITANAMAERLSEYEDVTVYLTHTDLDTDMSIKERAEFAASVNADFLFCLHYNMSEDHTLYGSEVWIQSKGNENRYGYQFAYIEEKALDEIGLFSRGIKTRLNSKGTDYYGIHRYCKELSIPAVLIEHCHLDHKNDDEFHDAEEDFIMFGILDADCVARFFHLSSEVNGNDFRDYTDMPSIDSNRTYMAYDTTEPDVCELDQVSANTEDYTLTFTVNASDYDSNILYYSVSTDGGITFGEFFEWPDSDVFTGVCSNINVFTIPVEPGTSPELCVRVYNQYNMYTESNLITGLPLYPELPPEEVMVPSAEEIPSLQDEINNAENQFSVHENAEVEKTSNDQRMTIFLMICLLLAVAVLTIVVAANIASAKKKRKKRRKKRL